MADEQTFEVLLSEFRRVGVDPDTFSAMLALRPEDALRALRSLPDGAGASAFLARVRSVNATSATARPVTRPARRDKTA